MIDYFWSALTACQFLVERFGEQAGIVVCIATIVGKAITAFTAQYATGQLAELDPPDEYYDAQDWYWNEDYCNGQSAKRSDKSTSMVYDLHLVGSGSEENGLHKKRSNYQWWHQGTYRDSKNITKHMYAGGEEGGTYDTYMFGLDMHTQEGKKSVHRREDVPSLVYEFADIPAGDFDSSPLITEECLSHEITKKISEALAMQPDDPIDGCYGFYDDVGWLGWMYIHLTLADGLDGLNDEDRYEHFGQCYDAAAEHAWGRK